MGIKLFDYQLDAVERMHNGYILCGDVGSGKSRTGIAYYFKENGGGLDPDEYVCMNDPPQDLYIITTAQKRDNPYKRQKDPYRKVKQYIQVSAGSLYPHVHGKSYKTDQSSKSNSI